MDLVEFTNIGQDIVRLTAQLSDVKEERAKLDAQIAELEQQLVPLTRRHAELVAGVLGHAAPAPVSAPIVHAQPGGGAPAPQPHQPHVASTFAPPVGLPTPRGRGGPAGETAHDQARARILKFLDTEAEPGIGALEVGTALGIDPSIVRQVMFEMVNPRG